MRQSRVSMFLETRTIRQVPVEHSANVTHSKTHLDMLPCCRGPQPGFEQEVDPAVNMKASKKPTLHREMSTVCQVPHPGVGEALSCEEACGKENFSQTPTLHPVTWPVACPVRRFGHGQTTHNCDLNPVCEAQNVSKTSTLHLET
mmetsp:Transcript_32099/g.85955  ORF Transcript_32099/g.85955 Transcript_32099/m.85955 type:complete len:145 (-) Transcript_32099:3-437(-)